MSEQGVEQGQQNFRKAKSFLRRVLQDGFEGMEIFNGTNEENTKLIYDCYEMSEHGWEDYVPGDYICSLVVDVDREGAYRNEELAPNEQKVDKEEEGLISRPTK